MVREQFSCYIREALLIRFCVINRSCVMLMLLIRLCAILMLIRLCAILKIINPINSGSLEEHFKHLNILCLP